MQSVAFTPCCSHGSQHVSASSATDIKLPGRSLPRQFSASSQSAAFRPFRTQQPKLRRQRLHTLTAVSESSPALKKPEIASKPQVKESKGGEESKSAEATEDQSSNQVTIQFQREQAKAMRKYFKSLAYSEEVVKSQYVIKLSVDCRVFGWTPKNEITNGRWVMFGFAVGLLTEYATGVDFIQQLKLMVSYLGIADIYD